MARPGFVYVAGEPDAGIVKIGSSVSPAARARELRLPGYAITPSEVTYERIELLAVWRAKPRAERWLHRQFATRVVLGEWYRAQVAEVQATMERLPASYRPREWEDAFPPPIARVGRNRGGRRSWAEIAEAKLAWEEIQQRMAGRTL